MLHWILLFSLSVVTYLCISFVGYLTNSATTNVFNAIQKLFDIKILLLILVSNIFFVSALYYGFLETSFAITIAIVIGVITSFVFSAMMYGMHVTFLHVLGIVFILAGIYLLR